MASCKSCGKSAAMGVVFHAPCLDRELEKIMENFCSKYCKYPHIITDEESRINFCNGCKVMRRMARLGNGRR